VLTRTDRFRRLRHHRLFPLIPLVAIILILPLLFPSAYYFRVAALVFIFAIAALGLNLLMGFAGQVSLGHAGFMGVGAYAVAIGPSQFGIAPLFSFLLGAAFSAVLAFIVGRPILRLRGHYLAVATLGFGVLLTIVFTNEAKWTGGPDGMAVQQMAVVSWTLRRVSTWYWVLAISFLLSAVIALNLIDSPTGRALRAIHDSERAARVLGVDVAQKKLAVFVISAVYASVAGSFFALINGYVTPDVSGFLRSIELVAMVVLGGMGSIVGSLVGSAVLVILPQALTIFHDYEHAILGLTLMAVMIFLRRGIVPSLSAALSGSHK
jgi:branched-chain amino acid transport system permease protein